MSFVKKLKDILFEDEPEDLTEPIKVRETIKETMETKPVVEEKSNVFDEEFQEVSKPVDNVSERNLFRAESGFKFPDFDEEEFAIKMERPKPRNNNALEYERKKNYEHKNERSRYERVDSLYVDKKKFKPSPIISPVYGVLNQDYRAEDIVNKGETPQNINIEEVRKKAFEPKEVKKDVKDIIRDEVKEVTIDEPVVTFFEEKSSKVDDDHRYKTIDELLEESRDQEIEMEDVLEMPKTNNIDAIEEELENIETNNKVQNDDADLDDTLDTDLFELIDSMYDTREEE